MGRLIINQDKVGNKDELVKICPFGALEIKDDKLDINSGCKMCKLCVRKGPEGAVVFIAVSYTHLTLPTNSLV